MLGARCKSHSAHPRSRILHSALVPASRIRSSSLHAKIGVRSTCASARSAKGVIRNSQQRLHVFRFQRVEQAAAPRTDEGDVLRAQRFFVHREMGAAAHQHHDVAVGARRSVRCSLLVLHVHDQSLTMVCSSSANWHRFLVARAFFRFALSGGQRIAQCKRRIRRAASSFVLFGDCQRQHFNMSRQTGLMRRGVRLKSTKPSG